MKTINLKEAKKLATPGPLQSWPVEATEEDNAQIGLMPANPPQSWCAYVEGYEKEAGAALLAHRWNTHDELVEALADAFFQFEHNGEESGSDKEVLDRMQAVLARAKTVEMP